MKFVIEAYKCILKYVVLNCIIVSSLGIYAEFRFPVVEF